MNTLFKVEVIIISVDSGNHDNDDYVFLNCLTEKKFTWKKEFT